MARVWMAYIESAVPNGGTVLQEGRIPSVVLTTIYFLLCSALCDV